MSSVDVQARRPTVAEIDLTALRANYLNLKAAAGGAELMVVVKADAYGHGALEVSRELAAAGCNHFGVATVEEGRELRDAGLQARIYVMGGHFAEQAREIVVRQLTPFVFDLAAIEPLDRAAAELERDDFAVHLKLDTGATRLGVRPDELPRAIDAFRRARSIRLEGACTLLANANDPASTVTDQQLSVFRSALTRLDSAGFPISVAHVANSAALVLRDDARFNLLRPGLAIYGLPPVPAVREKIELRPVMTFKTRLLQLKRVPAGTGISYGHTFVTERPSAIGILPVGYADGYRRGLQNGGEVVIRGSRAPVVGAVCMDLTMVDLTDVAGASVGDEVILWGGGGETMISVNDLARLAQTISYELLCGVGSRVPRIYGNQD